MPSPNSIINANDLSPIQLVERIKAMIRNNDYVSDHCESWRDANYLSSGFRRSAANSMAENALCRICDKVKMKQKV